MEAPPGIVLVGSEARIPRDSKAGHDRLKKIVREGDMEYPLQVHPVRCFIQAGILTIRNNDDIHTIDVDTKVGDHIQACHPSITDIRDDQVGSSTGKPP